MMEFTESCQWLQYWCAETAKWLKSTSGQIQDGEIQDGKIAPKFEI